MNKKWPKIFAITAIFLVISYFITSIYYNPATSLIVAFSLAIFVLITLILVTSRRSMKVMADRQMKCPHCGRVIEAAFIENKLAMELSCPFCKGLINEQQAIPLDKTE